MGANFAQNSDGGARTMKLAIASTLLFLLLNSAGSDAIFKRIKIRPVQEEDLLEPTRVADPWPEDTSRDGCDVVYDDVWEEKCTTVYNDTKCHDEKDRSCEWVPHKVCKTKYKKKCKLVLAHKCHSFKVPKCKFAVEKKCQNKKKCEKIWDKKCEPHYKDVCKDVKIRVVPDAVKYDYPEEHSSPLTYDEESGGGGGGGGSDDTVNITVSTREDQDRDKGGRMVVKWI